MFVKEIAAPELAKWLAEDQPPLLFDVRTPQEMVQASIPQGKPLPLNMLPWRIQEIPQDQEVVFYCRTGARSAQACMFMAQQGYKKVYNLYGGIINWAHHGFPVIPMNIQ